MRLKRIALGSLAGAIIVGAGLAAAPAASAGAAVDNSVVKESAIPYFKKSIQASSKMVKSSDKATALCEKIITEDNQAVQQKLALRAGAALSAAYGYSIIRSDLYSEGEKRTNTKAEKKAQAKAYPAVALSAGAYNEAISICDAAGVDNPADSSF